MLLNGINHIALISRDIDRLRVFYTEVFDAEAGPTEPDRQTPMWGRGRLDHFGLQAASAESFETIRQRLVEHGASDGEVNDFDAVRSVFFRDPDGLEGEVLVAN